MIKILIIASLYDPYFVGGAEYSSKILAENLNHKEFKVDILTSGRKDEKELKNDLTIYRLFLGKQSEKLLSTFETKEKKYHTLGKIIIKSEQYLSKTTSTKIKKFLQDKHYDIYHITTNLNNFGFREILKGVKDRSKNSKILFTLRDPSFLCLKGHMMCEYGYKCNFTPFCNIYRKTNILILNKYVDFIHSPSNYLLNLYKKNGLKIDKSIVIPNAVDEVVNPKNIINNFSEKRDEILYIGSLNFHKGTKTLLQAFKMLNNNNFKLVFIGRGKKEVEEFLKLQARGYNVEFAGWLDKNEVNKRIKTAKVVVLPSEWPEAFGRTLIESLINGTLVIGSNAGAIPEVVQNEKYLFEWGNYKELSKIIKIIMNYDKDKYVDELMGFIPQIKKFSLENHITRFSNLYKYLYDEELINK